MVGLIKLLALVVTPVPESEVQVFLNRWHPQTIINNRLLVDNHKSGTRDYDPNPWYEPNGLVCVSEGSADSWRGHLQRMLMPAAYAAWQEEMTWRYECWNTLDDYVNYKRYGYTNAKKLQSLSKLKSLLSEDAWACGWMPQPIPTYTPEVIGWLQDLWTDRTGFQGRKNNRDGINPLRVDVPIRRYGD